MSYVPTQDAAFTVTTASANTTLTAWNTTVLVDASAGPVTITLPTAVGNTGEEIEIVKTDSTANAVTIDGNSTETVNGAATLAISKQRQAVSLRSDGANVVAIDDAYVETRPAIRTVSADDTIAATDRIVLVDASGGAVTLTLPLASTVATDSVSWPLAIKKIDSTANAVNVARAGADTIEQINSSPVSYGNSTTWNTSGAAYEFIADNANARWNLAP